jgi:acetyl-CoA acyltransferase
LPHSVAGVTVNRFCSSGLQTIAQAAERIMAGFGTCTIAGGAENMTQVRNNARAVPNPELARDEPGAYLSMGMTAENVATRYGVSREDQDAFALRSHVRALAATSAGYFAGSIVPLACESGTFEVDEGPRSDTSAERLAALKPAFLEGGSVTAGNSSQTSDGAAAVVLMERTRAHDLGITPLARFVAFAVAGVAPDVMGIGPIAAIPKALRLAGLSLADIDLIELNEAFASQALAVVRDLDLDMERVNVNGGAIALGHPLGASGAKLTVQLLDELRRRGGRYGMVTMCIGGGQGAAGIFELLA